MQQAALYSMLNASGFSVQIFEDYPEFFGNWRVILKRGQHTYEVVSDNREGWLSLWRLLSDQGQKLFEIESTRLTQEQQLIQIAQWLEAVTQIDLNM
ncbi:hypothetical protein [Shewanella putrefaciens]|uniref:hypothetical protein n=1 Tax=Shewanella putrefaciens TaxID=24 RepID=UPI00356439E8